MKRLYTLVALTWNPWIGCTKVSPGCQFCYAEEMMARRWGKVQWGLQGERKRTSEDNWDKLRQWNRKAREAGRRAQVFVASLADVFEDNPQVADWREYFLNRMLLFQHLNFLLLTKRPENIPGMVLPGWMDEIWPANVWVGTSVENQEYADKRIPALLEVPAPVRFLSCEPLLGPVDLWHWLRPSDYVPANLPLPRRIEWVIVGGESGGKARPMNLDWARQIRDDCAKAGTAFFMKQVGGTRDKGERLEQIPPDLRIRQFPQSEM